MDPGRKYEVGAGIQIVSRGVCPSSLGASASVLTRVGRRCYNNSGAAPASSHMHGDVCHERIRHSVEVAHASAVIAGGVGGGRRASALFHAPTLQLMLGTVDICKYGAASK